MVAHLVSRAQLRATAPALIVAFLVRLIFFFGVMVIPMNAEDGGRVSPLLAQTAGDHPFYAHHAHEVGAMFSATLASAVKYLGCRLDAQVACDEILVERTPGPALPFLIHLFDYRPGHTLPLAVFFLGLALAWSWTWLLWLNSKGVATGWQFLFAMLPTPVWYMILIQTDLPYAVVILWAYLALSRPSSYAHNGLPLGACMAELGCLFRPNALTMLPVYIGQWLVDGGSIRRGVRWALLSGVLLMSAIMTAYYLPYALKHITSAAHFEYFGIDQADFRSGLFPSLPHVLDLALSWLALGLTKLLYLCGIRPSYSGVEGWLVLLRALPGLFTLPGLLFLIARGQARDRLFVFFFILPFMIGVAQERYILAILPILFYYSVLSFRAVGTWVSRASRNRANASLSLGVNPEPL